MKTEGLVLIGKIGKAHGLRGQVKMQSYAESPRRFAVGRRLTLRKGKTEKILVVAGLKEQPRSLLLAFEGMTDRNEAESLNGYSVYIQAEDLEPLPEGEYYHHQLIGTRVYDQDQGFLGRLDAVFSTPAHDVWVVKKGKREWLYPAVEEVVLSVDLSAGEIRVRNIYDATETNDH